MHISGILCAYLLHILLIQSIYLHIQVYAYFMHMALANNIQSFRCKARPLLPRKRQQRSSSRTFYANNRWLRRPGQWPGAGAVTVMVSGLRPGHGTRPGPSLSGDRSWIFKLLGNCRRFQQWHIRCIGPGLGMLVTGTVVRRRGRIRRLGPGGGA